MVLHSTGDGYLGRCPTAEVGAKYNVCATSLSLTPHPSPFACCLEQSPFYILAYKVREGYQALPSLGPWNWLGMEVRELEALPFCPSFLGSSFLSILLPFHRPFML